VFCGHADRPVGDGKTAGDIDEIAESLQQKMLEGYSQTFKDEVLKPANIGTMQNPDAYAAVTGVCGDTIEMYLAVEDGRISDIKFMTDGCGATIACASFLTRTAKGESIEDARRVKPEDIDKYFEGLPEESKHCAKLSADTLKAALTAYESGKANLKPPRMKGRKKDVDSADK